MTVSIRFDLGTKLTRTSLINVLIKQTIEYHILNGYKIYHYT